MQSPHGVNCVWMEANVTRYIAEAKRFVVIPKRWIVGRTFAWVG